MNCTLLLHSTTGNTRLLAGLARDLLEQQGHACRVHDILREPGAPDLTGTDLLLVANPTMYFRPTLAMERFVDGLPAGEPRPALLLGTASGEPGAHFELLARQLRTRGWVVLGAHWSIMPTNWPPHRRAARPFALARPLATAVARLAPAARGLLALPWPDLGVPGPSVGPRLQRFLRRGLQQAAEGRLDRAPAPEALHRGLPGMAELGRRIQPRMMQKATDPRIDAGRCGRCGTCVTVCPAHCITREHDQAVPVVGPGYTGCWSCFNHCPDGAIAGWFSPAGTEQYRAPSPELRRLFRRR